MKQAFRAAMMSMALVAVLSGTSQASPVTFANRATWLAAVGPVDTVDFSAFLSDTDFKSAAVDAGPFSLQQAGTGTFRNMIDVAPLQFSDNNGTTHSSTFTNFGFTTVNMTYDSPVHSWGADFNGIDAEGLRLALFDASNTLITTLDLPNGASLFFGFILDPGIDVKRINFQSRTDDGQPAGGEGFGLDNVSSAAAAAATVPEPATVALFGTGIVTLMARRRRRSNAATRS